jgi:hypothetical protein
LDGILINLYISFFMNHTGILYETGRNIKREEWGRRKENYK